MEGGFQYEGGLPTETNEVDQTKNLATEMEPLDEIKPDKT